MIGTPVELAGSSGAGVTGVGVGVGTGVGLLLLSSSGLPPFPSFSPSSEEGERDGVGENIPQHPTCAFTFLGVAGAGAVDVVAVLSGVVVVVGAVVVSAAGVGVVVVAVLITGFTTIGSVGVGVGAGVGCSGSVVGVKSASTLSKTIQSKTYTNICDTYCAASHRRMNSSFNFFSSASSLACACLPLNNAST